MGLRAGLAALGVFAASCGGGTDSPRLHVLAAASLTEALSAVIPAFEVANGVDVSVGFDGSPAIVRQALDGAPADVVITADESSASRLGEQVVRRESVARNRLTIVTRAGNPERVRGVEDLTRVTTVVCDPSVPCGRLAQAALDRAGVDLEPASLELNVKAVVAKVALGEADAGIVYATDAEQAGASIEQVELPDQLARSADLQAVYPALVLRGPRDAMGRRFVDYLLSPPVQRQLAALGFGRP